MLLAQLVLPFLGLQEAVELFLLLALDVLLELLLIIGKVLGLREGGERFFNNSKPMTYNTTNRLTFKQDNVLALKEIAVKLHLSPRMPGAS